MSKPAAVPALPGAIPPMPATYSRAGAAIVIFERL